MSQITRNFIKSNLKYRKKYPSYSHGKNFNVAVMGWGNAKAKLGSFEGQMALEKDIII